MSNFDFGGGPGPGQTPPPPIQLPGQPLPGQPQQQFAPGGLAAPIEQQPPVVPPQAQPPAKPEDGGITPAGLISLIVIVVLMLGVAWTGNRFWPISSGIDSAWRSVDGNARELTSFLRKADFTCSDEGEATAVHFHRACARFTETSKLSIEYAGPTSGEIMRVYIRPHGRPTAEDITAATRAIELSVPDQNAQREVVAAFTAGAEAKREVNGPWGQAGWVEGTFTVARTWAGPSIGTFIPGSLDGIRTQAAPAGYRCDSGTEVMQCQRVANGASWTVTAYQASDPEELTRIRLTGAVNDAKQLNPAAELTAVLPKSPELNRLKWFVSTADKSSGQAGFARGLRVDYTVAPGQVEIEAYTTCRLEDGNVSC